MESAYGSYAAHSHAVMFALRVVGRIDVVDVSHKGYDPTFVMCMLDECPVVVA